MGSDPISFDAGSEATVEAESVSAMIEMYCLQGTLLPGGVIKEFPLKQTVSVDSVSGTLSFKNLNWSWWKKLLRWFGFLGGTGTAICGFIGYDGGSIHAFDIQGDGEAQISEVNKVLPGGVKMSKLVLNLYADLSMPTDFRIALSFHRSQ